MMNTLINQVDIIHILSDIVIFVGCLICYIVIQRSRIYPENKQIFTSKKIAIVFELFFLIVCINAIIQAFIEYFELISSEVGLAIIAIISDGTVIGISIFSLFALFDWFRTNN